MLDKIKFEDFIDKAIETFTVFKIWTSYHSPGVNKDIFNRVYGNKNAHQCARAFDSSLQHSWILGITRLLDPPKSQGQENLSIKFIIETVDDLELTKKYEEFFNKHKEFINSYRKARNKILAHNAITDSLEKTLKKGVEDFFMFLSNLIIKIKKQIYTPKI